VIPNVTLAKVRDNETLEEFHIRQVVDMLWETTGASGCTALDNCPRESHTNMALASQVPGMYSYACYMIHIQGANNIRVMTIPVRESALLMSDQELDHHSSIF
jgi:hypothetical protein